MDFKPIETVPGDLTEILGLWGRRPYKMTLRDYYVKWPHDEGGPTFRKSWTIETWDGFTPCKPTHWMHMPKIPEVAP